ncbi:hypothetical protein FIONNBHARTH_39 [Mycobacterium phage Fionnbharth]|uniref:LamD-like n=2 Tax=Fionnbharthvirus fionnbharth TaxID=2955891 RepID=A0A222ZSQ5_9CAUD|nr:HTH DNA binding protein [Mycobacterium phage Fionnbharth]AER26330.1 hypothetical protein FIONNBHARTH_39 [Mycobacterium phage Fionnbharth]ASR87746.1 LamD-like [Mycobacterium phage Wintermute]
MSPTPTGRLSQDTLTMIRDAYPGPENKAERDRAIELARLYATGSITVETVAETLAQAREQLRLEMAAARGVALAAIAAGEFEKTVAEKLGIDRMTLRDWQGKRRTRSS